MKKLFTNGIGGYKYLNAKKVNEFFDKDGNFWKNCRVSVWQSETNELSSWRRFENETKKCKAKFTYSPNGSIWDKRDSKVSDYFNCLMGEESYGHIIDTIKEPLKSENEGYWIAHDGNDFVIFRLYDAWGHCDSAEYALDYHDIESTSHYDDFINLGITRIFTSGHAIMVTTPENHLDDILYLLSISPKFGDYVIETVSRNQNTWGGRDKHTFGKIKTHEDLLEYYS